MLCSKKQLENEDSMVLWIEKVFKRIHLINKNKKLLLLDESNSHKTDQIKSILKKLNTILIPKGVRL